MRQQDKLAQFGLWLRASSPNMRNDKGFGRHGPRKGLLFSDYDGGEEGRSTGGENFFGDSGSAEKSSPNPKRTKTQKETGGDEGSNQEGVANTFLSRVSNDMAEFQNMICNGKKGGKR